LTDKGGMDLLLQVECDFNLGDTVMVEQEGRLVEAEVKAIIIEVRGEVNVYYELHSQEVELDYPLVIEEYLVNLASRVD
jgi:hypothetical protein